MRRLDLASLGLRDALPSDERTRSTDDPDDRDADDADAPRKRTTSKPGKRAAHKPDERDADSDDADAEDTGKRATHKPGKRAAQKPDERDADSDDADAEDTGEHTTSKPGKRAAQKPDEREADPWDALDALALDPGDSGPMVLSVAHPVRDRVRIAFAFFEKKGLTAAQAAGIVGNLLQESSLNPGSVQRGGPGRGIAQWSVGARWDRLLRFAKSHGGSPRALNTQLGFLWHELTTVPAYGLRALRAARGVAAATRVFANSFEVCGACNHARRLALAQAALRAYGSRAARRTGA